MSLNKKVLAAAIVGGLFAGSAQAAVNISADNVVPVRIASEVVIPADGLTVVNMGSALDLVTETNYALAEGEVRYARIACSDSMEFPTVPVPTVAGGLVGAVNGLGTNAIHFSITGDAGGIAADAELTVAGDREFNSAAAVSCEYSLYDQPSQAAAGGPTGRIALEQGAYATFASSYLYDLSPNTATSSVEADPSFSDFLPDATGTGTSAATAVLGSVEFDTRGELTSGAQPIVASGASAGLGDILGANTAHVVTGDFSAAANPNGTFTDAALARVFFSANDDCSTVDVSADALTANSATFRLGSAAVDSTLCFTPRADALIPASEYNIALNPVSNTGYNAGGVGPERAGTIVRDGTELQAPLVQRPNGWISRVVLTNTGGIDRSYDIGVQGESGNTIGTGTVTGTVGGNSTVVLDVTDILTSFSGSARATLNVTVAGPNDQIQGLYQIVNADSGSISNETMVRPGTN